MDQFDVIVVGAGAAGMMCALEAGQRGRSVLLVDHAAAVGEKIRISGGGRCNFTNLHCSPQNFISDNPHFCISALSRYSQFDFIELVKAHSIAFHEKTRGQLFCDGSAKKIIAMLTELLEATGVEIWLNSEVISIEKISEGFQLHVGAKSLSCSSLVIASGGKSIPKMGASGFGYKIAEQFGLTVIEPRPGLVPFTFDEKMKSSLSELAGVSVDVSVKCNGMSFDEAMLFTHRGLSGPAILQISSYWREGDELEINLLSGVDLFRDLKLAKAELGRQSLQTVLARYLPKRVVRQMVGQQGLNCSLSDFSDVRLQEISKALQNWRVKPNGSEGYRTAEVTLGGVDTKALSSKTMEVISVPGLYFIGEVVDVTGWLGGYNFQWAWSSGWVAGQVV